MISRIHWLIFIFSCSVVVATSLQADATNTKQSLARAAAEKSDARVLFLVTDGIQRNLGNGTNLLRKVIARLDVGGISLESDHVGAVSHSEPQNRQDEESHCLDSGAIGCFWLVESGDGYILKTVFFNSGDPWRMSRPIATNDESAMAEITALILNRMLDAVQLEKDDEVHESAAQPPGEIFLDDELYPQRQKMSPERRKTPYKNAVATLGTGYHLTFVARRFSPFQGIEILAAVNPWSRLSFYAHYVISFSQTKADDQVSLRITPHPMQLGGRLMIRKGGVEFAVLLGLTLNMIKAEVTPELDVFTPASRNLFWQWSVYAGARLSLAITRSVYVVLGLGVDLLPQRPDYTVAYANGTRTILSPWLASPMVQLGIAVPCYGKE